MSPFLGEDSSCCQLQAADVWALHSVKGFVQHTYKHTATHLALNRLCAVLGCHAPSDCFLWVIKLGVNLTVLIPASALL